MTIIPSTIRYPRAFLSPLIFFWTACFCQAQSPPGNVTQPVGNYAVVQSGPNSKIWQVTFLSTNTEGEVTTNSQSYTELATGLCYLTNGVYVDSVEEVDPVPGGAQAVQGRHQVYWALNANTPGGDVTVTTPDGKQLSSTVFGLAYYDTATGSNVAIGTLQNCTGSIIQPNQVLYTNAFTNLTADILYTYTKAGLSQDIVLRQAPLAPDRYGLGDASTILQVYTEFFNAPQPEMTMVTNNGIVDSPVLDFGEMKMAPGGAFLINEQGTPSPAGNVSKQWVQVTNGTFLIESISYSAISNQLQQLPQASNIKPGRGSIRRLALLESKPSRPRNSAKEHRRMQLAKGITAGSRLKIDYDLLSSSTNLTLQGDTTYFVTNLVNITGTTTIEGGTVVKYSTNASAQITTTNIICATGPYSPGVFTSMNDNTVGSVISGSTGSPTNGSASYLNYGTLATTSSPLLYYLRFSYANQAITGTLSAMGANSITIWDCQFLDCGTTFYANAGTAIDKFPIYAYNDLYCLCGNVFSNSSAGGNLKIYAYNITADKIGALQASGASSGTAQNSLFTDVTNRSNFGFGNSITNISGSGFYTNVGAASYYLVQGSTNQGTGNSSLTPTSLLADLQTKTTHPPIVEPAGWFTNDYMFAPQAQWDTNATDYGYHYSPIDYALNIALSNATITVLPGTVLAGCGSNYGVRLYTNGIFDCEGTATSPNYMVRYNTVQEQSTANWESTAWVATIETPSSADLSWANFAFTDWSVLAGDGHVEGEAAQCPFALQDCQFFGGYLSGQGLVLTVSNCLFRRVSSTVSDQFSGNSSQSFCNNLFLDGGLAVYHMNSGPYTFRDNLCDGPTVTLVTGSINYCSNNAYVTTTNGFLLPTNGDIFLTTSPAYQTGALGAYYYPTNLTNLIHTGSQPAPQAGLYFYTVTTNNAIEGTNTVSIGFHYVAVSNGIPIDTDSLPAVPDYLNDLSGNGVLNPFLIFDQLEYPNEPNVRLGYWRFNNTNNWTNEAGISPTSSNFLAARTGFSSNCVSFVNTSNQLIYPITYDGQTLFNQVNGTIRFWFQPNWNSTDAIAPTNCLIFFTTVGSYFWEFRGLTATNAAGSNIGTVIQLCTANGTNEHNYSFSDGNDYSGSGAGAGGQSGILVNFKSNEWYQIVLTYSPTNIAFYTNGFFMASATVAQSVYGTDNWLYNIGLGNIYYPALSALTGFSVGARPTNDGAIFPAMGQFDELETFNYPMTAQQVAAGFPYFGGNASNRVDTYYLGVSDMLQTYVYGFPQPAATNSIPVRLGYWRFDSPLLYAEQGQIPLSSSNVATVPSWSGTALSIGSNASSQVTYPDVGSNGWANINCQQGSLRFWFKPNTSTGPGYAAPFVYMGTPNYSQEWALWLSSAGNDISFVTASNGGGSNVNFIATHSLNDTNHWTQIVLTYGPSSSSLYTNGSLAKTGLGVSYWPSLANRQLGLVIGNNMSNAIPINGQFEEMETFNYQLSAAQIANNFQTVANVDSDLDGVPDYLEDINLSTNRPFLGAPVVITGTIEAEQFDMGGQGIAYSNTFTNSAYCYRPTGMMISSCSDRGGGYCLDQMQSNEWALYTIEVLVAQNYMIDTRVSGIQGTGGVFRVEFTNGIAFSNSTGSLTVPTATWTDVTNVVYLPAGIYAMKLHCLANASGCSNVGRFNYISIYPWWPPPTNGPGSPPSWTNHLTTGSNFESASSNAYWIQYAVNSLPSNGGTITIPEGTWYVSQAFPNDANPDWSNAVACITNSNVTIAGGGTNATNTILIANNRSTTIFVLGKSPSESPYQCTNFTLADLTLEASPHEVAFPNASLGYTNFYELGQLSLSGSGGYQGSLATFWGTPSGQFSYNICVSNCVFLNGVKSLVPAFNISNFEVLNCTFISWPSNGYFTITTNNGASNTTNAWTYNTTNWQTADVGIFTDNSGNGLFNAVILSNTYIGNSAMTNVQQTYSSNQIAPDGFVWFKIGGNAFVAGNTISNYALEGVHFDAGPNSVVGNNYGSLVNDGSCCALNSTANGDPAATGSGFSNYSTCFVGNSVIGCRAGQRSSAVNPLVAMGHTLNFSGNSLYLYAPFNTNGDGPGYVISAIACQAANVCGNTLANGSYGFLVAGTNVGALILNNNFAAASWCGIGYQYTGASLGAAQIFGNSIGQGVNYHLQLPYSNSFSWFLGSNTYWNINSNPVPLFADPASSATHIYQ